MSAQRVGTGAKTNQLTELTQEILRLDRHMLRAQEELELCAAEAFENGRRAIAAIDNLLADRSVEDLCAMLDNGGLLHYGVPFGMLRDSFLDPSAANRAKLALTELKGTIRERAALAELIGRLALEQDPDSD